MKKFLIATIIFVLSGPVLADNLKEFDFDNPTQTYGRASKPECKFDNLTIPDNAVVYAAGAYSGKKVDFQIDQSGHSATQFDIAVNSKKQPVILMLGAYEPTIWNIGWSRRTEIVAVLVSGYHRQVVAGLQNRVPLLNSSYDNRGPCGYFYVGKNRNTGLNARSRRLFNRPVKLVYPGNKTGQILIGDEISDSDKLVTNADRSPNSFRDTNAPLAGKAGLNAAVAKGIIRKATRVDADRWIQEKMENSPALDVPPVAGKGIPKPRAPRLFNAYVVLKEFTYPAGLYGGNSATFFINKGVPKPKGNPGHSSVYDFNSLQCLGALCRAR